MNTVLDNNMKLCLNNGEIIQMGKNMNMIFEPMDLLVASPATVSRVGIIYYESSDMGWKSIYASWISKLPENMDETDLIEIDKLFNWIIDPVLHKIRRDLKEISPTVDQNLVVSCLRLFRAMLCDFEDKEFYDRIEISQRLDIIDGLFIFSLYWSLGASVITSDRKKFDIFIRKLIAGDIPGYK
jgi:dynein heavy chain